MNQSMQSIYGVARKGGESDPHPHSSGNNGGVPRSLLTSSNRGVIYQQRGIGRQISSWLLEPVKLQGNKESAASSTLGYAVDIKKSLPKLGLADQAKQAKGRSSVSKGGGAAAAAGGTVLPSISGKLNPYRTSDIKFLKKQNNLEKGQRDNWQGSSPGKRKKVKRSRTPPKKQTRLQSKVEIYSTNAVKSRPKPAKVGAHKPARKQKGQALPKTFHTSNLATRAKLLTAFLRQSAQNVDLLEDTLQFISSETKHDILMRHAQLLVSHQYYFSSIRIAHQQQDSLGTVLQDLMQRITGSMQGGSTVSRKWKWNLVDHELFVRQFGDLKIVQQYRGVRKKLLGMGENGVVALARVEKEILLKVVSDFMEQLSLPSYPKAVVSELMKEETGASAVQEENVPEEPAKADAEEFSLQASKRAQPVKQQPAVSAPGTAEKGAPPTEGERRPPSPPTETGEVAAPSAEKSWQEIEKERLEEEMRAVREEMGDGEKSEKEKEVETPAKVEPAAEEESKKSEPPAEATRAEEEDPAPAGTEAAVEAEKPAAEEASPPPPAPPQVDEPAPPPPPQDVAGLAPRPPPPAEEAAAPVEPVLSERELLEKEREAMQRELEELEREEPDARAEAATTPAKEAAEPEPIVPPVEELKKKEEEEEAAKKAKEEAEARAKAEAEMEALKKQEAEAKAAKDAKEKKEREEMEATKRKEEAEAKAAKEKKEREEMEAMKRKMEAEAKAAKAKAEKEAAEKAKAEKAKAEKAKAEKEAAEKEAREKEELKKKQEAEAKAAKEKKEKEEQAAVKIQSKARGMLAKKKVSEKREAKKEEQAAIKIQSKARGMLAKKKVGEKRDAQRAQIEKENLAKKPEPESEAKPEPEKPEADDLDDIEKLREQALEEQKRIAKEEGVDFESTLTKPVEETREVAAPVASAVDIAPPAEASPSPIIASAAPVPEEKPKPIERTFEDVVALEEEKQEKAEQDIEQAIKKMREEMRQEKERLRKEMEEKRRKLQEARQRKRESATWKKTPITISTESPLKADKEPSKLTEAIQEEPEPVKEEERPPPLSVMKPEPVPIMRPAEVPKPREPEAPKASFEKEIHQALQHVQEQLAMQQQQFLQMQFTNMQMTPGGPMPTPLVRGGMPMNPMMTPLKENAMATPGMQQMGQAANNNPPTQEEINEYAVYLGMDPVADKDLLYIAEWALSAPLPEGWTEHVDTSGNEFYFNSMTGVSTYEHPLDGQFREYYRQMKMQNAQR
ncbi:hypothetical protein A3770_02p17200 [Chloropicon primus]|uniref:WW domain-containing protein n=1 Tax=Chloropicon primus TaxID=1764295 RepID=A0A5B8MIJ1_9CHLO|nr:hypothetical protein A3770_02p17200 [Chloropicon primus]|eukprot:QDZ19202.1 hypothetical protein A3770_02p17200 [Chloropicon primus]